jgi:hypothetical protein
MFRDIITLQRYVFPEERGPVAIFTDYPPYSAMADPLLALSPFFHRVQQNLCMVSFYSLAVVNCPGTVCILMLILLPQERLPPGVDHVSR